MGLCLRILLPALILISALSSAFGDQPTLPGDVGRISIVQIQGGGDPESAERYFPDGNGMIPIADPFDYPRIPLLDCSDRDAVFYTYRPNLLNIDVDDEWDFYNLINTDRPDFTDATFTVGKGVTILESGYTTRITNDGDFRVRRSQVPESLARIGVTDELEVRIKWNGVVATDALDLNTGSRAVTYGSDDLILGFKYEIAQQQGLRPMLTTVMGSTVPSGTRGYSADQLQPFANLVYGWGLRRWLYLKGSTGTDFLKGGDVTRIGSGSLQEGPFLVNSTDNVTEWHQSFSLLYQISPRIGGFSEWFVLFSGNSQDNRPSHFYDTGIFYYLTPNVQLDARVGTRISDRVDTIFTGAGFSTRF